MAALTLAALTLAALTLRPQALTLAGLALAALALPGALVRSLAFALKALALPFGPLALALPFPLLTLCIGPLALALPCPLALPAVLASGGTALRLTRTRTAGATLAEVAGTAEAGSTRSALEAGTARAAFETGTARSTLEAGAGAAEGPARIGEEGVEAMPTLSTQQLQATFPAELRAGEHAADDAAHHRTGLCIAGIAILGEAFARRGEERRDGGGRDQKSLHARYPLNPRRDVISQWTRGTVVASSCTADERLLGFDAQGRGTDP